MSARQRITITTVLFALTFQIASACLWDSDTLSDEAAGHHELLNVITGRFPRNPPVYYEARLRRVEEQLQTDPNNLALYDDAGVACDRLGRSAEGIEWMEKKALVLAAKPDKEHQYRYHANLGTFLIHDWITAGADPEKSGGEQGAEHIRKAIEINPEAHFGRERLQLIAIEWILAERSGQSSPDDHYTNLLKADGYDSELAVGVSPAEAIEGLCGMVTLGAAWQSVDIYRAIAFALAADRRASMAYLANSRIREMEAAGKSSLSPRLKEQTSTHAPERVEKTSHLESWYREARKSADAWQQARTGYIESQIAAGKHPDTHTDFWAAFDEEQHQLPRMPKNPLNPHELVVRGAWTMVIVTVAGLAVLYTFLYLRRRQRKKV